ncbi:hypothetical protein BKA64DRAFT_661333 [Cadophora sp. MPI-SDFR-AT-0126]|nr:hypothetical protein BKA64DRAFT_661333 [Leotiomycetes sp. MPI-SDFR-AT-0126]
MVTRILALAFSFAPVTFRPIIVSIIISDVVRILFSILGFAFFFLIVAAVVVGLLS